MNSSGKVVTIFLIILMILFATLTATASFFLSIEKKSRQDTELALERSKSNYEKVKEEIKDIKKQKFFSVLYFFNFDMYSSGFLLPKY